MLNKIIRFFLENKLVTVLLLVVLVGWGLITAPFNWDTPILPTDPVPVDAIPNIGENQQIVFTKWPGRSPQDIEDQISYPLTTYLLGMPGVKSIRSTSVFGFSSIYIIFNEDVDFYWSRSRILEKLNALPADLLPGEVQPSLGPDATALGQIYWYTLEGRDSTGQATGGWDLHEIRKVQDFYVKYALNSAQGVSEVASIGGFVQEYQVDVNPSALKAHDITLGDVMQAVRNSHQDVGAKTIEVNQAEYLVRGLGYVKKLEDLEKAVVSVNGNTPVYVKDIAEVSLGPASRRGVLDKDGAEVVGGVVVARFGANPMEVIQNVKDKIEEIAPGLPSKKLRDGRTSQLTIVPFYDRSGLIKETLGTLEHALSLEILITILVVIVMVFNLRASLLISGLLPISVLMVFIAMRYFGVTANIVALSGIAIAIGTMVDLGVILSENILKKVDQAPPGEKLLDTVYNGATEVGGAILTAVSTTIVSFIPVFTMQAEEGKLFGPLAYTKTFALIAALIVTLLILPTLAYWFLGIRIKRKRLAILLNSLLVVLGIAAIILQYQWPGFILLAFAISWFIQNYSPYKNWFTRHLHIVAIVFSVTWLLGEYWLPLGAQRSYFLNFLFVGLLLLLILGAFSLLKWYYQPVLRWCLQHKKAFFAIPAALMVLGLVIWLGFNTLFGFLARAGGAVGLDLHSTVAWEKMSEVFPGVGEEFMPSLDEGSFLLMPTSMPHSGMEYNRRVLGQLDMLVSQIPEVEQTVGKMGRVESALDPAPISMFENIINYKPEYITDEDGHRKRFKVDEEQRFILKNGDTLSNQEAIARGIEEKQLLADEDGLFFRNWRSHVRSPDDIWNEIVKATRIPGVTSAPKLQPIETRLVMLQTGMRAPMGIKVYGQNLDTIEDFGRRLESILKEVPSVKKEAVFAERIVGKPYLHLDIKRDAIARYGLSVRDVQQTIETAIGGREITSTVEGRQRFPVRVRYPRELRDNPSAIANVLVATAGGSQIPLGELVDIQYQKGPQAIKSEETFLVGYVLFDKIEGVAEVEVVNAAQQAINRQINSGALKVPPGINYKFSGDYQNQVRAERRLSIVVPLVLVIVFLILYFQFKSVSASLMIFTGIAMAFSGGFILIWLYGQSWFADFSFMGANLRDLFQIQPINLSVAVWVGFIALFGIATDDGVLMGTYLDQSFARNRTRSVGEIRNAVVEAGQKRIRPAVMTTSTTLIALLPILTSTGRGAEIMIPMAIPAFGGMLMAAVTYFIVPVLYAMREEKALRRKSEQSQNSNSHE